MTDQLMALLVDEGKWLTPSLGIALLAAAILVYRSRDLDVPGRHRVLAAMNLFYGMTIGTMAFGHLLAVSIKLVDGTLQGSVLKFYAIGVALAIPSWWLVYHAWRSVAPASRGRDATPALNIWLAITLLALGVYNVPLAAPAFLNVAYHAHTRRSVGWAIAGMAVLVAVGLFIGSLIFMASGQSFEQFQGID